MRALGLVLTAALVAVPAAPAGEAPELDARLIAEMERRHIPGAVVAIVHEGEVERVVSLGLADRESKRRVDADTSFMIGSVSKTMPAFSNSCAANFRFSMKVRRRSSASAPSGAKPARQFTRGQPRALA